MIAVVCAPVGVKKSAPPPESGRARSNAKPSAASTPVSGALTPGAETSPSGSATIPRTPGSKAARKGLPFTVNVRASRMPLRPVWAPNFTAIAA